ncbi:MAG: recombinase family protein [Anaerovoracaceae bacterium]
MINIKLGYIRGVENSRTYKTQMDFLNSSNVDRIFHEKNVGNTVLNELVDYVRSGDSIFVYSIDSLGKNIKAIIRFIVQTQKKNVALYIKKEKFDSASQLGRYALSVLNALDDINGKTGLMERTEAPNEKGRIPRELADLRAYMKLVEKRCICQPKIVPYYNWYYVKKKYKLNMNFL